MFVGSSVSLAAQFSYDVGPTPYYIEIYDQTTGARLASCGYGTTCSATVASNVETTHNYVADVASWSTSYPPPNVQSASMTVPVTWNATIVLNGGQAYANGPANLTAQTTYDVGPTPYYIEIYDQTTGSRIAVCGSGTSCSVSESGYGTHTFVAYIAAWSAGSPPPSIQATSNPVTVSYVFIS